EIALTRSTVDVDTDGNGTADLLGATLDQLALSIGAADTPVSVVVTDVATLSLKGQFALARVTPAGGGAAPSPALNRGDVWVTGSPDDVAGFGLSGTLTINKLDYNSAAAGFARLDWATAFDLDGNGSADVLDPGAQLAGAPDLSIDFASSLQFAVSGSI